MSAYGRPSKFGTYKAVAAHGGVAAADPHRLVVMLMDGALERVASARGCTQIIDELRNSLDFAAGGELAKNLDTLYEYMCRKLIQANTENRVQILDEVSALLNDIRGAWLAIPTSARASRAVPVTR
jgi:flagellar protein FliS